MDRQSNLDTAELLRELRIDRGGPPLRTRRRRLLIAAAVVVVLGVGLWLSWGRLTVPTVRTVAARAATAAGGAGSVLDANGYVTARRQATVSAKITGKVTEVLIDEGMRVSEGAVLARLDDTEARQQVTLSRAQLAAAKSQDGEIRAQLDQAERDYVRTQELFKRQLVAEQSLDAARAQRDTLRAKLIVTEEQVRVAGESLKLAEVQLDNCVIRAPFAGVVVAKSAQPGEMISPISAGGGFTRTGIGTIVDMDSLEIQVDVNESFINRVTPGQPVEATLNAYPDWKIPGSVIAIIPTADRSKATVKVRIAIRVKDPRVVPDMGVRVAFLEAGAAPSAPVTAGVLVPADAIRGDAVFVVADGKVERRAVTPGQLVGSEREVLKGLRAGERVVLAPPPSLRDGAVVRIADR